MNLDRIESIDANRCLDEFIDERRARFDRYIEEARRRRRAPAHSTGESGTDAPLQDLAALNMKAHDVEFWIAAARPLIAVAISLLLFGTAYDRYQQAFLSLLIARMSRGPISVG